MLMGSGDYSQMVMGSHSIVDVAKRVYIGDTDSRRGSRGPLDDFSTNFNIAV